MFKNIIIVGLVFLLCYLMFQNKENIKIIAHNLAETKKLVSETKDFVTKTFEDEFSVEEFNVVIDIPSLQIEKEPLSEGSGIKEETFFNEEVK